jgi:hypothetical protein
VCSQFRFKANRPDASSQPLLAVQLAVRAVPHSFQMFQRLCSSLIPIQCSVMHFIPSHLGASAAAPCCKACCYLCSHHPTSDRHLLRMHCRPCATLSPATQSSKLWTAAGGLPPSPRSAAVYPHHIHVTHVTAAHKPHLCPPRRQPRCRWSPAM